MRSSPIIFPFIATFIFFSFLSCSTSKKVSTVPPAPEPVVLAEKKKAPPPPPPVKEEPAPFSYQTLYFDFDSAAILYRDSAHLDRLAEFLLDNKEVSLIVAGHADERGSFDYNLSLGEQRAIAIRSELQKRGIAPERVRIVSYGEERPAVRGDDETAYSQNRRAEFDEIRRSREDK